MRTKQRGGIEMLVIYGIAIVGVIAVAVGAWASFTNGYREEGRGEVRAELAPLIEQCARARTGKPADCALAWQAAIDDARAAVGNLASCRLASDAQSKAVEDAQKREEAAKAQTSKILAEIAKRSDATQAEISKLKQIAAAPAATRKEACDAADSLLSALAARRLRYSPGSTAATGSSDGRDQGAGTGALRIGQ